MAYRVVLSAQAEAGLTRLYVGARLRWEDIKRYLAADPHERDDDDRIRCTRRDTSLVVCTYTDTAFPRIVLYTVEPDPLRLPNAQVVVWRFIEKPLFDTP